MWSLGWSGHGRGWRGDPVRTPLREASGESDLADRLTSISAPELQEMNFCGSSRGVCGAPRTALPQLLWFLELQVLCDPRPLLGLHTAVSSSVPCRDMQTLTKGFRAHLGSLGGSHLGSSTEFHLQRPFSQISPHSQVLGIRTQANPHRVIIGSCARSAPVWLGMSPLHDH